MTRRQRAPADLRVAPRGNCIRNPGLLERILRMLLATLLSRPRSRAWHALTTSHDALLADLDDSWDEWEQECAYAAPLRGWHADCDPSILYVIGPPPNRGMRASPRRVPTPRPRTARAPPARRNRPTGRAAGGATLERLPPGLSAAL